MIIKTRKLLNKYLYKLEFKNKSVWKKVHCMVTIMSG